MTYTLHQIVKQSLLIGRNGPYKHVSSLSNLIRRKQLKAIKGVSLHGSSWIVEEKEIKKYNDNKSNNIRSI